MRIFQTKDFAKQAIFHELTAKNLRQTIKEFEHGLRGDSLGSNLFKKRVAIGNKGKSAGLRIILAYPTTSLCEKIFCLYLFAKCQQENITTRELTALKRLAQIYTNLTNDQISNALKEKILIEIKTDDDKEENRH